MELIEIAYALKDEIESKINCSLDLDGISQEETLEDMLDTFLLYLKGRHLCILEKRQDLLTETDAALESLFEQALEAVLTEEEKQALQGTWYCL